MNTAVIEVSAAEAKSALVEVANAKKAATFLTLVSGMTVESTDDYEMATDEVKSLKAVWDAMEEDRTSFTVPLNAVLTKINARFQPHLKTLKDAELIIKGKMSAFLARQEALVTEQRAQAERTAAAERERLAEQANKLREAAAGQGEAAQAVAEAQAEALEQTAEVVIAQPVQSIVFKGKGVSTPKTLDYEVTDMLALLKHIVEKRPDLVVLIQPDDKAMKGLIKMMGMLTALPGVRVFPKTGITIRAA